MCKCRRAVSECTEQSDCVVLAEIDRTLEQIEEEGIEALEQYDFGKAIELLNKHNRLQRNQDEKSS